jgi:hypothetical protein
VKAGGAAGYAKQGRGKRVLEVGEMVDTRAQAVSD